MSFEIEEVGIGKFRRLGTLLLALAIAILTLGAGTIPTGRRKLLIHHLPSNSVIKEIDDNMVDISNAVKKDFSVLNTGEFVERWLPELAPL